MRRMRQELWKRYCEGLGRGDEKREGGNGRIKEEG
jgi:hypothetical protein